MEDINRLTEQIIGSAIEVHRQLGPGLLESAYRDCLCYELTTRKIPFRREVVLPVQYKEIHIDCGYRMDFVIEDCVVVELKAVETVLPVHKAQLLTYLKLSGIKTGLLINFNCALLKNGIVRMVF